MGCGHSQFDSGCSSCLLQYDQAESAKWAAEEANLHRLNAEDHYRRMEREAARRPSPQRPSGARVGPTTPIQPFSNRTMMWILVLGAVIVLGSSVVAFLAAVASAVVQLVKMALVIGVVAAVGFYLVKKRRE